MSYLKEYINSHPGAHLITEDTDQLGEYIPYWGETEPHVLSSYKFINWCEAMVDQILREHGAR